MTQLLLLTTALFWLAIVSGVTVAKETRPGPRRSIAMAALLLAAFLTLILLYAMLTLFFRSWEILAALQ